MKTITKYFNAPNVKWLPDFINRYADRKKYRIVSISNIIKSDKIPVTFGAIVLFEYE